MNEIFSRIISSSRFSKLIDESVARFLLYSINIYLYIYMLQIIYIHIRIIVCNLMSIGRGDIL